jgi:hypothetical protein
MFQEIVVRCNIPMLISNRNSGDNNSAIPKILGEILGTKILGTQILGTRY